jgi:hypothetical protein
MCKCVRKWNLMINNSPKRQIESYGWRYALDGFRGRLLHTFRSFLRPEEQDGGLRHAILLAKLKIVNFALLRSTSDDPSVSSLSWYTVAYDFLQLFTFALVLTRLIVKKDRGELFEKIIILKRWDSLWSLWRWERIILKRLLAIILKRCRRARGH